jgi:hypothetical protein
MSASIDGHAPTGKEVPCCDSGPLETPSKDVANVIATYKSNRGTI